MTITAVLLAIQENERMALKRKTPYRVRVVGPSGVEFYLGQNQFFGPAQAVSLVETSPYAAEGAKTFATRDAAETMLDEVEPALRQRGYICDVVNIYDPEEQ